ncbi:Extracellular ligand-binding receptor [Caldicellulosiruptor hydrothermalis 108]|uniref:Extracellular ligand-binding receptor n=1 Tax=Caldicellulosiruptor hydrothermalis (strain DSM 18901 / VKM B-2411 / 108) TaxID=632292 RepID=E4Q7J5_CALH1|nr:ABC transporter substrate-binding protein [Caldicellulosiruptor hydrothermalis]ADQ07840.1 Extracellular ligand-binding receptor [Caldicellulosiruptor hydrothermalis 108]
MKRLKFQKILGIMVVLVLFFLLVSYAQSSSSKTIRIGVNLELSGSVAQFGQRNLEGLRMAIDEINSKGGVLGKKIELVVYDNKSDKTEALNIATRLATKENVLAMLSPVTSGATKSASIAATRYKVPLVSATATDDSVTIDERTGKTKAYVFRICFNDSFQGSVMANFALKTLKLKTAAIIYDASSDYSKGLYKNFKETFTKGGGKVVAEEAFVKGEQDFNGILTKIRDKKPQAIFAPVYYDEAGLIIKQARELGMWIPILGSDGFDDPKVVEKAGSKYATNIFFSTHYSSQDTDKRVQDFRKRYQQKYKIEPNALSALGYDLGYFIADAIKRANSTTDREKLRRALENTKNFVGVTGIISIDAKHNAKKSAVIIEIKNGVQRFKQKLNP